MFSEFITLGLFLTSGFAPRGCLMFSLASCCTMAADQSSLTAIVPSSPPAMVSDIADKINSLTIARTKLGKELNINHECVLETIERKDRTVKIKKWPQICKKCSGEAVSKNKEILFLTSEESDKAALKHELELLTHIND